MAVLLEHNLIPTYVEDPDGSTIRCSTMSDEDLRKLMISADNLVACAPGRTLPSRAMRETAQRLWEIHQRGAGCLVADGEVSADIGITVESRQLMTQDGRRVFAGRRRHVDAKGRHSSTAVVALAPAASGSSCDVVVRIG